MTLVIITITAQYRLKISRYNWKKKDTHDNFLHALMSCIASIYHYNVLKLFLNIISHDNIGVRGQQQYY